jgi:hypothetical protein
VNHNNDGKCTSRPFNLVGHFFYCYYRANLAFFIFTKKMPGQIMAGLIFMLSVSHLRAVVCKKTNAFYCYRSCMRYCFLQYAYRHQNYMAQHMCFLCCYNVLQIKKRQMIYGSYPKRIIYLWEDFPWI